MNTSKGKTISGIWAQMGR